MANRSCRLLRLHNARPAELGDVPELSLVDFRSEVLEGVNSGGRVVALFGQPVGQGTVRLFSILGHAESGTLGVCCAEVKDCYPSLTTDCPQVHWFEREIAEQWGIIPEGHPWLKPIRFHRSYAPSRDAWRRSPQGEILPCVTDYFRVDGREVHEVAVGPVHAGVIEPGHFRFQCHGEHVFHLEISLGYQHRGIERHLAGGPNRRTIHYMETLAGDTSTAHATAYCHAVEGLADCQPSLRAQALRGVMMELERLANHTGDLGALADDVGFLPTSNYCGRLRGEFLNASASICGSRFGRGMVRPGGAMFDVDGDRIGALEQQLADALKDVAGAIELLWKSASVGARFEDTGEVSQENATALGLVGIAARACGVEMDVRHDFPTGIYRFATVPVSTWHTGDVFARAFVRALEIQSSGKFVLDRLASLPSGELRRPVGALRSNALVVSLVEGWRGEVVHVAITDNAGKFAHYKVVDPSFHNWIGLAMSLRNQEISDFPLCNKSFNLSYCGHDL